MKLSIFSMNRPAENAPAPAPGGPPPPDPLAGPGGEAGTQSIVSSQDLRLKVLERILRAASGLGVLILAINLPSLRLESPARLAAYAAIVGLLVLLTYQRQLPYTLRVGGLILIFYAVGVIILVSDGPGGAGFTMLLSIPIFASLLGAFRRRSRLVGLGMALATLLGVAGLMIFQVIPTPLPDFSAQETTLLYWATVLIAFALVAVASVASIGMLLDGLEQSMERQNALTLALQRERTALEERVQQRTQSLERRQMQIRTAAEVVRAISRVLDIDHLLPQVCELVRQRFNLYYVGVFLIDEKRPGQARYAQLAAGSGEAGQRMLAENHRLLVGGDSMIGWAAANRQPRIALDVGKEAVHFNNPHLPRTRSELALPIISGQSAGAGDIIAGAGDEPVWGQGRQDPSGASLAGEAGRVIGAITIQSEAEAAFDQEDIVVLQGIADALASALENARLFATTQASLEEVRSLHRHYLEGAWAEQIEASGELAYTFQAAGLPAAGLPAASGPAAGSSPEEPPDGVLEIPLRLRDQVIGGLALEPGDPAHPWTDEQKALVEAVAIQAALALENARLLEETSRRAEHERAAGAISSQLWASSDIDTISRTILKALGSQLHLSEGWLELWPEDAGAPPGASAAQPGDQPC